MEDAKAPLSITVTRRDVDRAVRKDATSCALANGALHCREVISARIGAEIALIEFKDKVIRYGIKREDQKKIRAFDAANYFQPDTYQLVPPRVPLSEKAKQYKAKPRKGNKNWQSVYKSKPVRTVYRSGAADAMKVK